MSDNEFEKYLAILGGLLRLNPKHREEIAAELRDHLEERLERLLAEGYSRHKAILIALEEFGDAAGLAGDFLAVFRRQRRRWFMKMTVGSLAVCVCLAIGVFAVLPGDPPAPMIGRVVAQEGQQSVDPFGGPPGAGTTPQAGAGLPPGQQPQPGIGSPSGSGMMLPGSRSTPSETNNAQTEEKLNRRMACVYPMLPLIEVLRDFAEQRDVEVFVNRKMAEEAGINLAEQLVDFEFKNIRGDMLLDLMLRDAGLVYTIRDGIIVVTTKDDLESTLEVRVYNCSDLMAMINGSYGTGPMGGMPGAGDPAAMGIEGMPGMGGAPPGTGYGMAPAGAAGGMGMPEAGMSSMGSMSPMGMAGMPGMPGSMMSSMAGMSASGNAVQFGGGGGGMMPGSGGNPHRVTSMNALIHVITSTVMPDSWQESGGPGTIEAYYGGLLIVNNNPQVHRRVEQLLTMMRDAAKQPPGSVVAGQK